MAPGTAPRLTGAAVVASFGADPAADAALARFAHALATSPLVVACGGAGAAAALFPGCTIVAAGGDPAAALALLPRAVTAVVGGPGSISAAVRATGRRHFPFDPGALLPRPVGAGTARRLCLIGAESTGKTTLARDLALHFHTAWVPEYARTLVEAQDNQVDFEDSQWIAAGHIAAEDALAPGARGVLVCDTSTHSTILWSEWIYNRCYDWVRVAAAARPCDLYLVPCPDVPWIPDPQRTLGPRRGEFHDRVVAMLGAAGLPMRLISGSWEERRRTAIAAFEELLAAGGAA